MSFVSRYITIIETTVVITTVITSCKSKLKISPKLIKRHLPKIVSTGSVLIILSIISASNSNGKQSPDYIVSPVFTSVSANMQFALT